ncbi:MAG: winged helix-turn-helix transcriptional regulator [Euryarchaeota archaeon]|nr:winged helix-turn-helix transcriptional regulator [Euryarchaeota archaeon]
MYSFKAIIKLLLVFLVIVQISAAQELPFESFTEETNLPSGIIEIKIQENGWVSVRAGIVAYGRTELSLPYKTDNLEVFDAEGTLPYTKNKTILVFTPRANETYISFSTDALTSKSGSIWVLNFTSPTLFEMLEINVYLSNAILRSSESYPKTEPFVEPFNNQIKISWLVFAPDELDFTIKYQLKTAEVYKNQWLMLLGTILILIGAISGIIYLKRRKMLPKSQLQVIPPALKVILPTLDEKERKIIEELLKAGGKTTQAKLFHLTGLPKSSLHRILKELENKNLIKITEIGKTNLVELAGKSLGENVPK